MTRRYFGAAVLLGLGLALVHVAHVVAQSPPRGSAGRTIQFNRDIKPILSDKCFKCHGPGTQLRGLRLDQEESATRALRSGRTAIVAGHPDQSELIRRVASTDPAVRMPRSQGGPGEALSGHEVQLLRQWIEQGAAWQKHWAFIPPVRPNVPKVANRTWVRNPIDAFVLERLEREGLQPRPVADRATLLRRVTFDLTGLPPTPTELDAFLADRSPGAYERVVDRLLSSPRYGERMAFPWLEAARYADSNGYQVDGERFMWRWRDWVIDAFNRGMPYDQFAVEQLAGDLLPSPTQDQLIATGFNRNHRGNAEGGVIPEEYAVEYVVDRVDTTGTVFMGLTVGCARCHSHKYDPISHKDYYQLFAYFNNVPEHGTARRFGNSPPFITAPTRNQRWELKELDDQLATATVAFAALQPEVARAQREWERTLDPSAPLPGGSVRGLVAHYAFDGDLTPQLALASDSKPTLMRSHEGKARFGPGRFGQALSLDGTRFAEGGDLVGFAAHMVVDEAGAVPDRRRTVSYDDPYSIAVWIAPTSATGAIVTKAKDVGAPEDAGHAVVLRDGRVEYHNVEDLNNAIRLQTEERISLNEWHHVTVTYDGSRWASGVRIYVDGRPMASKALVDDLNTENFASREPLRVGAGGGPANRFRGSVDDLRIYDRVLAPIEAASLADPTAIPEIARIPEDQRSPAQVEKIRAYFLEHAAPAAVREAQARVDEAQARRDAFYASLPTVMVMKELSAPRASHILLRGEYDRHGETVTPGLPAVLAPSKEFPPDRLGLARWLVDPSNPLTARVTVNRFWQQYFGTGLVRTAEDFGSQGEPPSHPELLDWLATEFVRTGWDVKAFQKLVVMSATYQQSSKVPAALTEKDPANRLLARGPNVRLSAEMIRDQALAIAGLLVERVGGPSVKPYQPDGLWKELTANTGNNYVQDHGESLYRRSLYTFWKRTVPPPSMANFDASAREAHVVRVNVTNTPLQALDMMNDVAYLEAARVLAQRIMREGGATPRDRIAYAFRRATAHRPTATQSTILFDAFTLDLQTFTKDREAALAYVGHGEFPRDEYLDVGELAAYTSVASLILNLSETIVKN